MVLEDQELWDHLDPPATDDNIVWQWTEGNCSCQCNRMSRGFGIEAECDYSGGDVQLVSIIRDGRILYEETVLC